MPPLAGRCRGRVSSFFLPGCRQKTSNISLLQRRVQSPRRRALAEVYVGQPQLSNKPRGGGGTQQAWVYVFKVNNWMYLGYIAMETVSLVACLGQFSFRDVEGSWEERLACITLRGNRDSFRMSDHLVLGKYRFLRHCWWR